MNELQNTDFAETDSNRYNHRGQPEEFNYDFRNEQNNYVPQHKHNEPQSFNNQFKMGNNQREFDYYNNHENPHAQQQRYQGDYYREKLDTG